MKQPIQLSDHFTYRRLFRFILPSVAMMIFISIYGVVDGFFISNFVGKTSFAAVNFIMPLLTILGTLGFMFGSGGSALISKVMGEGDLQRANKIFSLIVYVTLFCGGLIALLGILFFRPIVSLLGADGAMLDDCVLYGRIVLIALPTLMLQFEFHSFFVAAGKPHLGLYITLAAGSVNMVLDALLTAVFPFGITGAAAATAISQAIGGIIPLIYFAGKNSSTLRLCTPRMDAKALLKACTNGSSELMSNISMSLVGMLYNIQLLKYAGETGVSAYGILMYVGFIFFAIFIGYSTGVAPVIAYHYGAKNYGELKNLKKKSFTIIIFASVIMVVLAEVLAKPLSSIFANDDTELLSLSVQAFFIFSFAFLFTGIAIFGSSFFTALNDGLTSALISFLRTLVFEMVTVLVFPLIWGINGIWLSVVVADFMAMAVTVIFVIKKRKKFHY